MHTVRRPAARGVQKKMPDPLDWSYSRTLCTAHTVVSLRVGAGNQTLVTPTSTPLCSCFPLVTRSLTAVRFACFPLRPRLFVFCTSSGRRWTPHPLLLLPRCSFAPVFSLPSRAISTLPFFFFSLLSLSPRVSTPLHRAALCGRLCFFTRMN